MLDAKKKAKFKKENFKEHYIDVAKGTILLPPKYEIVTVEKMAYLFSEQNYESEEFELLKGICGALQADRVDFSVYVNENDLNDFLLFHASDHISFSKQDANQYLGLLEASLKQKWSHFSYKRLQSKITRTERSQYIKIKHKVQFPKNDFFQTHYIITSPISTFMMIEIRTEIIDYEDLIKRIHYK